MGRGVARKVQGRDTPSKKPDESFSVDHVKFAYSRLVTAFGDSLQTLSVIRLSESLVVHHYSTCITYLQGRHIYGNVPGQFPRQIHNMNAPIPSQAYAGIILPFRNSHDHISRDINRPRDQEDAAR